MLGIFIISCSTTYLGKNQIPYLKGRTKQSLKINYDGFYFRSRVNHNYEDSQFIFFNRDGVLIELIIPQSTSETNAENVLREGNYLDSISKPSKWGFASRWGAYHINQDSLSMQVRDYEGTYFLGYEHPTVQEDYLIKNSQLLPIQRKVLKRPHNPYSYSAIESQNNKLIFVKSSYLPSFEELLEFLSKEK